MQKSLRLILIGRWSDSWDNWNKWRNAKDAAFVVGVSLLLFLTLSPPLPPPPLDACYAGYSKGTMIVSKTKDPQILWIPHGSLGLSQCKSSCKRKCRLTKISRKAKLNSKKQMVRKCVAFLTGRWGLAQRKSNCKEHAGSDKTFENITLFLDLLPPKIQFKKEKRTLKTLDLSQETNKLQ